MQKKVKRNILIVFITMVLLLVQYQIFNVSIVYAEDIIVGKTWEYYYKDTGVSFNDQEFVAPMTGVYEIKTYGETNPRINLRVKDANNPDLLITSYQIQGGNGAMACGYLKLNEGDKIFVHIMKGNSAGQIEQTTKQLQNQDLGFGERCFITKTGTYYDEQARIYTTGPRLITAYAGEYHCTDYEHGYSIAGEAEINTEMCPEINYKGITYSPQTKNGGGTGAARCIITLKATDNDNSIAYTVNHWQQNINGDENQHNSANYTLKETENLVTTIGNSVSPITKTYSGFTSPAIQTITINQNGTTTIDYYYTRNKYQYILEKCEGVTTTGSTPSGVYYYGSTITLKADVADGYLWSKWSNGNSDLETTFSMPANDLKITPIATKKDSTITDDQQTKQPQPGQAKEEDDTRTKGVLPRTGETMRSLFIISIILIASIIFYIGYRKYKDIN